MIYKIPNLHTQLGEVEKASSLDQGSVSCGNGNSIFSYREHLGTRQFICLQPYFFFLTFCSLFTYLMIVENPFSKSKGCIALLKCLIFLLCFIETVLGLVAVALVVNVELAEGLKVDQGEHLQCLVAFLSVHQVQPFTWALVLPWQMLVFLGRHLSHSHRLSLLLQCLLSHWSLKVSSHSLLVWAERLS